MAHISASLPRRQSAFMRLFNILSVISLFTGSASAIQKEKMIGSQSLATCMENSQFTVSQFEVLYTPGNSTLLYSFDGTSSIEGNVYFILEVIAYGYTAFTRKINPCDENFASLCPMRAGPVTLPPSAINASSFAGSIPGISCPLALDAWRRVGSLEKYILLTSPISRCCIYCPRYRWCRKNYH